MLASIEFQAVSKKQSYRPSDRGIETYAGRIRPVDSLGAYALITTPTFEKRLDRQTDVETPVRCVTLCAMDAVSVTVGGSNKSR